MKKSYERSDFIRSAVFEKVTGFFLVRSAREERIARARSGVGSRSEYEIVLLRAKFLRDALMIAERVKPSSSATFCASSFTFGSILIFNTAVFIYAKVYTLSLFCQPPLPTWKRSFQVGLFSTLFVFLLFGDKHFPVFCINEHTITTRDISLNDLH